MNKRNYHEYKAQTTNWWNSSMRLEWIKITTRQRLIGYIAVIFYYYHATKSHISYNDWSVVNDDGERKGSSGVSREVEFQHPPLLMTEGPVFRKERIVEFWMFVDVELLKSMRIERDNWDDVLKSRELFVDGNLEFNMIEVRRKNGEGWKVDWHVEQLKSINNGFLCNNRWSRLIKSRIDER